MEYFKIFYVDTVTPEMKPLLVVAVGLPFHRIRIRPAVDEYLDVRPIDIDIGRYFHAGHIFRGIEYAVDGVVVQVIIHYPLAE